MLLLYACAKQSRRCARIRKIRKTFRFEKNQSVFKKTRKFSIGNSRATRRLDIKFVQAQSDGIEALADYRERSKPLFLLYKGGSECARMEGANALELGRVVLSKASSK